MIRRSPLSRSFSRHPAGRWLRLLGICLLPLLGVAAAQSAADTDALLARGEIAAAETMLTERLAAEPGNPETRFALGAVQTLRSFERLSQDAYRLGLGGGTIGEFGMMFGFTLATNPAPESASHEDARGLFERFLAGLRRADATLEPLGDLLGSEAGAQLRLRLDFGAVRLDFDGDGVPGEGLSRLLWQMGDQAGIERQGGPDQPIPIAFDLGDALWLRGYLNLIAASLEAVLAYDTGELWHATAQLFFARPETEFGYLTDDTGTDVGGFDIAIVADVIAFVHLIDLPLQDPERLARALAGLETTVALSRDSWSAILAENDDEREWLPNPRQTGVFPADIAGGDALVEQEMIDAWLRLLDETEAILAGNRLVPYWRVNDGRGIDVRRVFLEPRDLDLILWLQGAAVAPYLARGEITAGETWREIVRAFGGNFGAFAFWFN